jgi:hypothetical protein
MFKSGTVTLDKRPGSHCRSRDLGMRRLVGCETLDRSYERCGAVVVPPFESQSD